MWYWKENNDGYLQYPLLQMGRSQFQSPLLLHTDEYSILTRWCWDVSRMTAGCRLHSDWPMVESWWWVNTRKGYHKWKMRSVQYTMPLCWCWWLLPQWREERGVRTSEDCLYQCDRLQRWRAEMRVPPSLSLSLTLPALCSSLSRSVKSEKHSMVQWLYSPTMYITTTCPQSPHQRIPIHFKFLIDLCIATTCL